MTCVLKHVCCQLAKVFEVRSSEELTEEWLRSKLGFFR